jgi:hypothetical protein
VRYGDARPMIAMTRSRNAGIAMFFSTIEYC